MSFPSSIKFGVRIHQGGYSYEDLRRVWIQAEALGYHSATLYDLLNIPTLECWTTLAALASETRRIRLVPLVLANPYRRPVVLAKMAATLDVISGGRLELGIAAGGDKSDHLAAGLPFPSTAVRVVMLEEAVQIIKGLWTGPALSFEGQHYRIDNATCEPGPVQRPHPPILIGGHGDTHLLRAVAAHADICNMSMDMSLQDHRRKRKVLESHCGRLGRDIFQIEVSHNAQVFIAEDESKVEAMLLENAARRGMALDRLKASLGNAIVGTPEQCASQVRNYVEAGFTYFFLLFPHPIELDALRLFAESVMPHFGYDTRELG